ncbi:glycosyltransferase family 2 protein [Metabacillus arenae]|uniref:Glycosyltransferase family 2 protein n=1 Tax=Metabacillus arenae TaxID=2771434 RepID=A0A926RZA6_9BACI|nr:glycosyltransferase family 2 protein [Metabacillus arenae]MBD1382906.1 glycosyltransferase family 2 protein [Metabacillus arenae]
MDELEKTLFNKNFFIKDKKKSFLRSFKNFFTTKSNSEKLYLELNINSSKEKNNHLINDIQSYIEFLGVKFDCKYLVAVGCNQLDLLKSLSKRFKIIGIDNKYNIESCKRIEIPGKWIEYDLEKEMSLPIDSHVLRDSIIICLNYIEYLDNPFNLLYSIKTAMKHSPICLMRTQERELQENKLFQCKRSWSLTEYTKLLNHFKFNIEFVGLTKINESTKMKDQILSIIGNESFNKTYNNPFKVVALMAVYNEEDIIYYSIKKLIEQKVYVYVIDNWSTDKTYDIVMEYNNNPYFIGCERFPQKKESHDNKFDFTNILDRKSELASHIEADWFIHCDADEIRESPWEKLELVDAIRYVDHIGYNAIDHTVINFQPIDNGFISGDFEKHFEYFEFGIYAAGCVKTWKKTDQKISLSGSGGHQAQFQGRKVTPFNFLVKHYPLRSQQHAEKKIFQERKPRYMKNLKEKGWHVQYNQYRTGDTFLRNPDELIKYSKDNFSSYFLVERLSNLFNSNSLKNFF